jgi:proteasome lid subunit RPN8/RPN11
MMDIQDERFPIRSHMDWNVILTLKSDENAASDHRKTLLLHHSRLLYGGLQQGSNRKMLPVIIEKPCFFTIAASCMEVYNREATGFLLGKERYRKLQKQRRKVMALEVALPLQTAYRKPTEVIPGNRRAYKRLETALRNMDYDIVGEYHSHIEGYAKLSKEDIDYAKQRHKWLISQDFWKGHKDPLELVVAISRRNYKNPHDSGWTFNDYAKKARAVFALNRKTGYDIIFGAYWYEQKNEGLHPMETEVYIPWWKGYWSD